MPWSDTPVVYLASATSVSGFAIDYGVLPLAIVDEIRVELDFDPGVTRAPVVLRGECPASFPASAWTLNAVNDVVWARIVVGSDVGASRSAFISYPSGSSTLHLDVSSIPPADRSGSWYVVYDPSWGSSRIAVKPATFDGDEVVVDSMPDGAAHVALIRTPLPMPTLEATSALVPQSSFATIWPGFADRWYGVLVSAGQDGPLPLRGFRRASDTSVLGVLDDLDAIDWTVGTTGRFVMFRANTTTGSVEAPCEGTTSFDLPYRASATLSIDGSSVVLPAGGHVVIDPVCAGSGTAMVAVDVISQTSEGWLVIRQDG